MLREIYSTPSFSSFVEGEKNVINRRKSFKHILKKELSNKQFFKLMMKELKTMKNFYNVKNHVENNLSEKTTEIHWKLFLYVANFARKEALFEVSREWMKKATEISPHQPHLWSEFAKLEEECGSLSMCENVLKKGLENNPSSENLYIKLLKHYEQTNDCEKVRGVLGSVDFNMSKEDLMKLWKVILAGTCFESRYGNVNIARNLFCFLMKICPVRAPVYVEAVKLEEKINNISIALVIVERGIKNCCHYAPLWFTMFRLYEKKKYFGKIRECYPFAVLCVSKEVKWKILCEVASIEESQGFIENAREMYTKAIEYVPASLRYKVWISGARTEMRANNLETARELLERALIENTGRSRFSVLLEFSKLEEWVGNFKSAREYIQKCKTGNRSWKVFLESILLELRDGNIDKAINEAEESLKYHPTTGRLWSIYIRLMHKKGEDKQFEVFKKALLVVPKSGEVWCEGARLRMNPLSTKFNLKKAKRYITFALKFTPQYGDSFIEFLRVDLLRRGFNVNGHESKEYYKSFFLPFDQFSNDNLEKISVNAEPNYGQIWFFCKRKTTDTNIEILKCAQALLTIELKKYYLLYQNAISIQNLELETKKKKLDDFKKKHNYNSMDFVNGLHMFFKFGSRKKNFLFKSIYCDSLKLWI